MEDTNNVAPRHAPTLHIRGSSGRPLCGRRSPTEGLRFAEPGAATCGRCWLRYRPPELPPVDYPPPAPLTDEQRAELAELRAALPKEQRRA